MKPKKPAKKPESKPEPPPESKPIEVAAEWLEKVVHASYSADLIQSAKIRKPFSWGGSRWICVGRYGDGCKIYRLLDRRNFDGKPTTYYDKGGDDCWESARNDPKGFYHGILVNGNLVMCGPPVMLVAAGKASILPAPPPIAGESDREYNARIDASRATAQLATKSNRRLDAGKRPITDAPLFGGPAQGELF